MSDCRLSDNRQCAGTGRYCQPVLDVPDIDRSSTTEKVASALRNMLFAGDLLPGTPLREITLADSFGVARSTVREALSVLTAEGLVRKAPNRGATVTHLSERDLAEIFEARQVLEEAGLRAGAAGADLTGAEKALETYARAAGRGDQVTTTAAHLDFHTSLVAILGNSRLLANAEILTGDLRLALASVERARRNARQQVDSHRRLLRLMQRGDVEAAVAELRAHLSSAQTSVTERVAVSG